MTKNVLYQKMDQIIIDEAFLYFWQGCQIHKKRGNRFGINPLNLLSLKK
jgi:hypothetical protein